MLSFSLSHSHEYTQTVVLKEHEKLYILSEYGEHVSHILCKLLFTCTYLYSASTSRYLHML